MHIGTIKAFAHKVAADEAFAGKDTRVLVRAKKDGRTLYIGRDGKFSAESPDDAWVYRYDTDKVGEQLNACVLAGLPVEVEEAPRQTLGK